jgi:7-carboxy-7-deazaguanine synthase
MLRVVETYVSYQGEGPNTSRPTVFVRFAGCNFKCPGWPCDTQHAIDPKIYRGLQKPYYSVDLADEVFELGIENVCLTGGEVFLQKADELYAFLKRLKERSQYQINVECFTNGGLPWERDSLTLIDNIILDWKLPGSGEQYENDGAFQANFDTVNNSSGVDAIKFTIKDVRDYNVAIERYERLVNITRTGPKVYAGVVWGQELTTETLCAWMIRDKLPWHLNVQVHKYVWPADKIGV